MLRKTLLAGAALALFATPALAFHCPMDAAAIDAGLAKASLTDAQKAEITALKDKGMAEHSSGNHDEAQKSLAEAMRKLLNDM
ncbi:MAG: hypothetical protein Q8P46_12020 [Hyphomicrobiales bacterium]|nr:hypothetical protein [Hyphomicrobiales bacterium]